MALSICLMSALPAFAAGGNGGNTNGSSGHENDNPPGVSVSATPELDSLALFGAGAVGVAGYALLRLRATRREHTESD